MPLSKTSCPVGQITGICSTSQEFRARAGKLVAVFFRTAPFAVARAKRRKNPIVADRFGKNLTRRAIHRHIFIIARNLEPAPRNWPRAFSIEPDFSPLREQSEEAIRLSPNDLEKI
jgi:hypothetical protein